MQQNDSAFMYLDILLVVPKLYPFLDGIWLLNAPHHKCLGTQRRILSKLRANLKKLVNLQNQMF